MNKVMVVVVIALSAAVVLLSGAVFYLSHCKCPRQFLPGCNPCGGMNMPIPSEQGRTMGGHMPSMPAAGGQPGMMPPAGQPDMMGGPGTGGGQQFPQGQGPQGRPAMGRDRQQGQQGGQDMGGQQGPGRQSGQMPGTIQGQAGSREQVPKLMQEAFQEAQNYFMSQNLKPGHQEMISKVKELLGQKMKAQGISRDIQQQVLTSMDNIPPPPQASQRPQGVPGQPE